MNFEHTHNDQEVAQHAVSHAHPILAHYLNIISTKRSGHHAFIAWIETGSRQRTLFFNNCATKRRTFKSITALSREQTQPTTLIFNYEGVTPAGVARTISHQQSTNAVVDRILFIRDPLNVCASLMHRAPNIQTRLFRIMRQMFALKSLLEFHQKNPTYADLVFYNRWLTDTDYRDNLARRLSLSPSPVGSKISDFGGGSSFRDLSHGGAAAAPKLLNRWKAYKDNPIFQTIVGNPHFVSTFRDVSSGVIRDANGESDFDEERADYLQSLSHQQSPCTYTSRLINRFAANENCFEKADTRAPRIYKRLLVANTYLRAVFPIMGSGHPAN